MLLGACVAVLSLFPLHHLTGDDLNASMYNFRIIRRGGKSIEDNLKMRSTSVSSGSSAKSVRWRIEHDMFTSPIQRVISIVVMILFLAGAAGAADRAPVVSKVQPLTDVKNCGYCPEMVVVPLGGFPRGGGDQFVQISAPFAISKYEITFAEWDACVLDGGCNGYRISDETYGGRHFGRGRNPAFRVSWDDAQSYLHWLSEKTGSVYRLPTEAEWQYAARAGSNDLFPWGDCISMENANISFFYMFRVCPGKQQIDKRKPISVGKYPPNNFGIHDVIGNVSEWVQDCWTRSDYKDSPTDGRAKPELRECRHRILRGGSWFSSTSAGATLNFRAHAFPNARRSDVGFRVVRSISEEARATEYESQTALAKRLIDEGKTSESLIAFGRAFQLSKSVQPSLRKLYIAALRSESKWQDSIAEIKEYLKSVPSASKEYEEARDLLISDEHALASLHPSADELDQLTKRISMRDCATCPVMISIPPGSFYMGGDIPDSASGVRPVHPVTVSHAFFMGRYEITLKEWRECVHDGGCRDIHPDSFLNCGGPDGVESCGYIQGNKDSELHPARGIQWADARSYAEWLSRKTGQRYRLPSESEWEYAARGDLRKIFDVSNCSHSTNVVNLKDSMLNHCGDEPVGWGYPMPVGSYPSNSFGLYDVIGNVAEWVEDCWHESYQGAPSDGKPWVEPDCHSHIQRGGDFEEVGDITTIISRIPVLDDQSGSFELFELRTSGLRVVREQ